MGTWELLELLSHSPIHAKYGPARLRRWFQVPDQLGQMLTHRAPDGRLDAVLTWASLSSAVEERFLSGEPLQPADWGSGGNLWFIDFIAPFGNARTILTDLKRSPLFRDARRARWLRSRGTNSIQHYGEARRAIHPSRPPGLPPGPLGTRSV